MKAHKHKFDSRDGICEGCGLHYSEFHEVVAQEVRELEAENAALLKTNKALREKAGRVVDAWVSGAKPDSKRFQSALDALSAALGKGAP